MADNRLLGHLNTLWTTLIVSTLFKSGIDTYFVSPGNRNTPVMAALGAVSGVRVRMCIDERAGAYRALGHGRAAGVPGVLVCTSGTAGANYYPAIIEAYRDEIPVIAWSADRPPELVGSDANQTIYQEGLYGRYVRKSLNLPCPSTDYPLRALLVRIRELSSIRNGPVHINLPFREPLLPVEEESGGTASSRTEQFPDGDAITALLDDPVPVVANSPMPSTAAGDAFVTQSPPSTVFTTRFGDFLDINTADSALIHPAMQCTGRAERGIVVAGRLNHGEDPAAITGFARRMGWPLYCDIASGLKGAFSGGVEIPFFDHPEVPAIVKEYNPEIIVQFGTGLVSKSYYETLLSDSFPDIRLLQITPREGIRDPANRVDCKLTMTAQQGVVVLENTVLPRENKQPDSSGFEKATVQDGKKRLSRMAGQLDALVKAIRRNTPKDALSHPVIADIFCELLPGNEALFTGNSLVIRAFDQAVPASGKAMRVVSNRGVSGIEGNLATAVGYAEKDGKRITAVLGDLSLLHDLNSLMLVQGADVPVVAAVINNSGGRIFERLPVARFSGIPGEWVTTPHELGFESSARQFGLPYWHAETPDELRRAYEAILKENRSALLEIRLSPEADLEVFHRRRNVRIYP